MDRFFAILSDGVHRFEGKVNQYTCDGITALFGAPIAHEDHARRACYAALFLRDAVRGYANEVRVSHGIPFDVRIGLNSSEVVVGKIGDSAHGRNNRTLELTFQGWSQPHHTVHVTAARLRLG
jgi:class 3 adenylate cyclase